MKIERVDLRGYGALVDRVFGFSPAINVVVGPNEAGKSTLMRAIEVLLYGHFKDSGIWDGAEILSQFEPWAGGDYGGTIVLTLASGERYRIDRRFDVEETRIYRDPGSDDVTSDYNPGNHGWVDFVDRHLGLSPAVFQASACIRQSDILLGRNGVATLRGRLEQLSDSGGVEGSAQEARATLDRQLLQQINPRGIVPDRSPLLRAQLAVKDLADRLRANRAAFDEISRLVTEEHRIAGRIAELEHERATIEGLAAWHLTKEFDDRLDRLDVLDREIQQVNLALADVGENLGVSEVTLRAAETALNEVARLRGELARWEARVDLERDDREAAEAELARLTAELNRLPAAVNASEADVGAAERAVELWAGAETGLSDAEEALVVLRQRRDDFEVGLDSRLMRVAPASIVEPRTALSNSLSRQSDFVAAQTVPVVPLDDLKLSELGILDRRLNGLTTEGLEAMRTEDLELRAAEAAQAKLAIVNPMPLLIGALAGLIVGCVLGYLLSGIVVGLVGGIAGVLLGAIAANFVEKRRHPIDLSIGQRRAQLVARLVGHGVSSVDDLQRRWNRRAELREANYTSSRLTETKDAFDRALEEMEAIVGVRDLDEAGEIVRLFEQAREVDRNFDVQERQIVESVDVARATLTRSHSTAEATLIILGFGISGPADARESLARLRALRVERATLSTQQSDAARALDGFNRTMSDLQACRDSLALAEAEATFSLSVVGVEDTEPESWDDALATARELFSRGRELQQNYQVHQLRRAELLGNDDVQTWRARAEALHARAIEPSPDDGRILDDLKALEARLSDQIHDVRSELIRVSTLREERSRDVQEPAEIEEQLIVAEAALTRLEYLARVLTEASSRIDIVAREYRRGFAPRLAESVSEWIGRATDGRYVSAAISPNDLSIQLTGRERGGLVPLDNVSQGTRDAVALLLRASIVDLLSNPTEPVPLFLDDPLVNVDPERTARIFDVLAELARTRQLFYFTQDPRIVTLVSKRSDCTVHLMDLAVGIGQPVSVSST